MLLLFLVSVAIGQEAAAGLSCATQQTLTFAIPRLRHRKMGGLRQTGTWGRFASMLCGNLTTVQILGAKMDFYQGLEG